MRYLLLGLVATCMTIAAGPALAQSVETTAGFDSNIRKIVKRHGPAVIGISCQATRGGYYGTGVMISADGLALTSTTVIPQGAKNIRVYFKGGQVRPAKLVASDKTTESVLIKADLAKQRAFVELADSTGAWVGQRAFTFGNPFHVIEYDGQVAASVGVVSGIYTITENGDDSKQSVYHGLALETDAAVNPGSDGGPLLDGRGRLLGIISLGFQAERKLGTVIPMHLIRQAIPALGKLRVFATPTRAQDDPVGAALSIGAERLAKAVVGLAIERAPEKPFKAPRQPRTQQEASSWRLRTLMARPKGLATGIVIAEGAYILTSAFHLTHQLEGRPGAPKPLIKKILVHAAGLKQPVEATVVARNMPLDLVLLKPAKKLPHAVSIVSGALDYGSAVGVVGRLRGSKGVTLSTGVVSTPDRNYMMVYGALQVDAVLDYANLGGPLIDIQGRVVGMAAFVRPDSRLGLNSGVGVCISAKLINQALAGLKAGKNVARPPLPFLGVGQWQGGDPAQGAMVATIYKGSSAFKAGLRPGDTIISVDGKPIGEWPDLIRAIQSKQIGDQIEFEVQRGDKKLKLSTKLGRRP